MSNTGIEWEIDKIIENPYTKVRIGFNDGFGASNPDNDYVEGFMIDDTFSITGSSTYTPNVGEQLSSIISGVTGNSERADKARQAIEGGKTVASLAGIAPKLVLSTIKTWEGSEPPPFTVGLLFVATKPESRPDKDVANIVSRLYPDHITNILKAPMKYTPAENLAESSLTTIVGTCVLEIGKWFMAEGLLIEAADFQASKECIQSGAPLYCTGTVTFAPYREISYKEYKKFFRLGV